MAWLDPTGRSHDCHMNWCMTASSCPLLREWHICCTMVCVTKLPHRMGKTTLLNHIAERKLSIPPNIDVLLCEQEVKADDTPAFDAVLSADTKRLALLEEEKQLLAAGEAGDDSGSDRLKQVGGASGGVATSTVCVCV